MSAAKHTPSPWVHHQKGSNRYVFDSAGCVVADVQRREDRPLVSSAPEMLEALHAAAESLEPRRFTGESEADYFGRMLALGKVRAAIAKATGGAA